MFDQYLPSKFFSVLWCFKNPTYAVMVTINPFVHVRRAMNPSGASTNSTCGEYSTGEPYREVSGVGVGAMQQSVTMKV